MALAGWQLSFWLSKGIASSCTLATSKEGKRRWLRFLALRRL